MKAFVLLTKYYSSHKITKNMTGWACDKYVGEEKCIEGFVGKPEQKRPLGRLRHG